MPSMGNYSKISSVDWAKIIFCSWGFEHTVLGVSLHPLICDEISLSAVRDPLNVCKLSSIGFKKGRSDSRQYIQYIGVGTLYMIAYTRGYGVIILALSAIGPCSTLCKSTMITTVSNWYHYDPRMIITLFWLPWLFKRWGCLDMVTPHLEVGKSILVIWVRLLW